MRDPSAAKAVVKYLDKKQPVAVRNHALLALFSLPVEGKEAAGVVAKLLPLLEESEFNEIVKPALDAIKIEPHRMWRVTCDLLLAFFARHLNGAAAPLLDGPAPDYPELTAGPP